MAANTLANAAKSRSAVTIVALSLCWTSLPSAAAYAFEFAEFPVAKTYRGKPAKPEFNGKSKGFASFKTRIMDAMKGGVTFAGDYSVAQFGCGTGCTTVIVANNRTGQLHGLPRGGEFNQALALEFEPTSKLMLARWYTDSLWETCVIEALVFEEGKWLAEEAIAGKGDEVCEGGVAAGAAKARGY